MGTEERHWDGQLQGRAFDPYKKMNKKMTYVVQAILVHHVNKLCINRKMSAPLLREDRRPRPTCCELDAGGSSSADDEREQSLAHLSRGRREGGELEVVEDPSSDGLRVGDGLELVAVLEARDAVRVGRGSAGYDELVV